MKKKSLILCCTMLAGCFFHPGPIRIAAVSLKEDGQPCFKVEKESVTANNQSRILNIAVSKRVADGSMHRIWSSNDLHFPIKVVVPGECILVDYKFEPYQEYGVTIYTIVPPDKVETKRFWGAYFQLQDLKP